MLKTTREQLEKLKALEAQATPGPWESGGDIECQCGESRNCWHTFDKQAELFPPLGQSGPVATVGQQEHDNAALIAESRNAMPALLHDAAVAHRLVEIIKQAISARYGTSPTTADGVAGKYRELNLLEALLREAKGAE